MSVILTIDPSSFKKVVVRGQALWIDPETFRTMQEWRRDRILSKRYYNSGPLINDHLALKGEELKEGGEATVWEISIFANPSEIFGKYWDITFPGETTPNPNW